MLGSNFIYKDKEASLVLTSVFNYLLNNRFVNYGAGDEARVSDYWQFPSLHSQNFAYAKKLLITTCSQGRVSFAFIVYKFYRKSLLICFMVTRLSQSFDTIFDIYEPKKEVESAKLMTIAKFAKAVELPVSTIRYWVKVEKLKPTMYTESGYMMFSPEQIKKVERMNQK